MPPATSPRWSSACRPGSRSTPAPTPPTPCASGCRRWSPSLFHDERSVSGGRETTGDRLVALRQEIRRAGADTRRVRNLLTAGGCLTLALVLGLVIAAFSWRDPHAPFVVAIWLLLGVTPALLIGRAVASGVAARYCTSYRA